MESSLEYAQLYAKSGLRVVPIWKGRKNPITPNGWKDASIDPEIIAAWYKGHQDAGVGIVVPEELCVVDVDSFESKRALHAFGMDLPATLSDYSGREGGEHWWYRVDRKASVSRSIGVIDGVDIIVNGYVVAPPSLHQTGRRYKWKDGFSTNAIADAPEWIYTVSSQFEKENFKIEPDKLLEGVPIGQRNIALFRYACRLRNVPGIGLKEAKILVKQVAEASEYKEEDTGKLVERVWKRYGAPDLEEERVRIWSLADLQAADIPPAKYAVFESVKGGKRGLLPIGGYTILSSPPKVGKSALAAFIVRHVSLGESLWGQFDVERGGVLYLDLEQGESDSKERWTKILPDAWPANLYTAFEWPRADKGGLDELRSFLEDNPHVNTVVIDTLADFWPVEEGDGVSNAYHREQRVVDTFRRLARDYGIALVLVHHDRKGEKGESHIKRASGTYAITGKAHAIYTLEREINSEFGVLRISGKNIPERVINLRYDRENLKWELV